jgi:hypothetical protein
MTRQQMIDLVNKYFTGVDGEDISSIKETLTPDCIFSVETHGVELQGHGKIENMFKRLWENHDAVKHHKFIYVPCPDEDRIAVRFHVDNTLLDGQMVHKSNCNFFDVRGDKFERVAVYMTGHNTLEKD